MGKKLSDEVAVDSDASMEDVSDAKHGTAEESSSESNSRQSSSDSDSGSEAEAKTNVKSNQNTKSTQRPAATFRPPPGFTSKTRSKPSSATSALSNLDGKQVFHIAAPSFLPLSQVREIALDKALLGEPILSHKGVDYGLPTDQEGLQTGAADSETLLIYDDKKGVYVRKELQNIPSYTVQELVRLPNHDPPKAVQVQDKPARPQPKHLKMRFHPVGSGNLDAETIGSSSESEAENDDHEPTFIVPRLEHKRKTDSQDDQGEKKKKKKEKHASSQEADQKRGRQDGESEKKASKHRNETSEERRARKEKKKRKAEKK
ncbi:hypothetical protein PISL3812_02710 [Talaromyces islandicus]|uniref:DNA-directed RNA polymerase I subunit RPA34 n=1 Tax=Talaromyces islandicus TaxID=28573 RepID=A0A0U1LQN9_TALIS|nr:hypothetical protein PISL3812_02710 [Talaromyces islandicus]